MKNLFSWFLVCIRANPIILIGISAVICVITAVCIDISIQHDRAGQIPLVFSEISQIKRNYEKQGQQTPHLTMYEFDSIFPGFHI